jgi:hypothetical protein
VPGGRFVLNEAVWKAGTAPDTVAAIHERSLADFGLAQASEQGWTLHDWLDCMRAVGFVILASDPLQGDGTVRRAAAPRPFAAAFARSRSRASSGAVTLLYRARAWFSPTVRRAASEYRKRVRRHDGEGRHIEAYVFVLEKPAASGMRE